MDPIISEAIDIYAHSDVSRGRGPLQVMSTNQAYVERYRRLAPQVLRLLHQYEGEDKISFADLEANVIGQSAGRRLLVFPPFIEVNTNLRSDVIAVSLNLVHEAVHRLETGIEYVEDEVLCRTLQVLYYRELLNCVQIGTRNYRAGVSGNYGNYVAMNDWLRREQLVDFVVSMSTYSESLSAGWVERASGWWGGIRNRHLWTKGHYVRALGQRRYESNFSLMLQILESASAADSGTVIQACGGIGRLREILRPGLYSIPIFEGVTALERVWAVSLR